MNYALAGLRIYLGVIFAFAVYPKWMAEHAFASALRGFLTNVGLQSAEPVYRQFLLNLIIPHVSVVAVLVVVAETAVAIAMITGTWTRLASIIAMLLLTNYMFAKGLWWWNPSSNDAAFFTIALVLGLAAAGSTLGIDSILARRWPKSIVW